MSQPSSEAEVGQRPLGGTRVVDLGWVHAGPVVGHILGDMGAQVIRVESRKRIDSMRMSPENTTGDPERDPFFHDLNRNKLGVTIDLSQPAGGDLLKRLVSMSDVLIENFAAPFMAERGLAYEQLKVCNPKLIMISLPAAGKTGPLMNVRTYNPTLSALAGVDGLIGYRDDRVLGRSGIDLDPNSALYAAFAVLAAIFHRDLTGQGQYIEVAQWETSVATLSAEAILEYTFAGQVLGAHGNDEPVAAPHNLYPCKGDDRWVSICVTTEWEWQQLCGVMGDPAWTREDRFSDLAGRLQHRADLDRAIARWTAEQDDQHLAAKLQGAGVAAMPAMGLGDRLGGSHWEQREMYRSHEHPITGTDLLVGTPWMLEETPGTIQLPSPMLGQHNEMVFREFLKIPEEEYRQLLENKVIF